MLALGAVLLFAAISGALYFSQVRQPAAPTEPRARGVEERDDEGASQQPVIEPPECPRRRIDEGAIDLVLVDVVPWTPGHPLPEDPRVYDQWDRLVSRCTNPSGWDVGCTYRPCAARVALEHNVGGRLEAFAGHLRFVHRSGGHEPTAWQPVLWSFDEPGSSRAPRESGRLQRRDCAIFERAWLLPEWVCDEASAGRVELQWGVDEFDLVGRR